MDVSKLEPADRDPVKLRNTALIITALMVVSSFVILMAYNRYVEQTGESDRPSFKASVTDNNEVLMISSDGVRRDLQDLKGNVTLAFAVTTEISEQSQPTIAAVRSVLNTVPVGEPRPNLLIFVLDGDEDQPDSVSGVLSEFGKEPQVWRVPASADRKDSIRAFMKSKMRYGIYPHTKDDEIVYDSQLVLLDQHLQIRGPIGVPIDWDFEKVAGWEAQLAQAKIEHPDKELTPPMITTEQLSELLKKSIDYLYTNPKEKGQK